MEAELRRVVLGAGLAVAVVVVALAAARLALGGGTRRSLSSVQGLLEGVSCSSATACTAVGGTASPYDRGQTLAARWNGQRWSVQETPNPTSTPDSSLVGVSCPSALTCIAVGETDNSHVGHYVPVAERWNGQRWSLEPVPHRNNWYLYGVSCSSAADCIAVGVRDDPAAHQPVALAERWNGKRWSVQSTASPAGHASWLYGVSCSSATACTAVGSYNAKDNPRTLAEQWNGHRWFIQPTPNPANARSSSLQGVSCSSPTACTAVGSEDTTSSPPFISLTLAERWNGHHWLIQSTPDSSRSQGTILHGVSCPTARACTAVGETESGFDNNKLLAERWDGHRWFTLQVPQDSQGPTLLVGLSCVSARSCVAVGGSGDPRIDQQKPLVEQRF